MSDVSHEWQTTLIRAERLPLDRRQSLGDHVGAGNIPARSETGPLLPRKSHGCSLRSVQLFAPLVAAHAAVDVDTDSGAASRRSQGEMIGVGETSARRIASVNDEVVASDEPRPIRRNPQYGIRDVCDGP